MNMGQRLAQKVAFVTGGGRGNGRAIALGLAREGADVALTYVNHRDEAEAVGAAIQALGQRCVVVRADVGHVADIEPTVQRICEELGRIDILVNNAGVLRRTPVMEITEREWDATMDVNLKGVFLVAQAVAKRMVRQGGGAIINVSSVLQSLAAPGLAHYCISKAGVGMLTKALALELAPHNVRVNAVAPGTIITDLNRGDSQRPEWVQAQVARLARGSLGEPDDLVGAVVFLAAEGESRMAVGTTIFLDNGKSIW
jgi:NAD(P)-dependent dehydrogenase (short-subunit alcohol dehydrogenase family)